MARRQPWTSAHDIDPLGSVTGASCSGDNACVAVDAFGNAARWNGRYWTKLFQIDALDDGGPVGVSCAPASFCSVVTNGPTGIVAGS